ncbi:MAG: glycosyltransferase family 4 protein [Cyanobacteria bacterium P01_A01_bin.17]
MKILFIDQSGQPGGAELCLMDIARPYRDRCLVALLADGPFKDLLEQQKIPVQVLAQQSIEIRKDSSLWLALSRIPALLPLLGQVVKLAHQFDVIYANTPKALVLGAIASLVTRRPLVYHLHDILSASHFSRTNRQIAVTLANRATLVIANSHATQAAFTEAGGRPELTHILYNGFQPDDYQISLHEQEALAKELDLSRDTFWIGHFSRLSHWKGQHILLDALALCPEEISALFVGDALFGEADYVQHLQAKVKDLGLENRVRFLGFRNDVPQMMSLCHLITHTSTAPEPFGRVIVEAMLCGRPVIAANAGGATELINSGQTGWLCEPNAPQQLADQIVFCHQHPEQSQVIAKAAQQKASQDFNLSVVNQQLAQILQPLSSEPM